MFNEIMMQLCIYIAKERWSNLDVSSCTKKTAADFIICSMMVEHVTVPPKWLWIRFSISETHSFSPHMKDFAHHIISKVIYLLTLDTGKLCIITANFSICISTYCFHSSNVLFKPFQLIRAGAPTGMAGGNSLPSLPPAGTLTRPPMPH